MKYLSLFLLFTLVSCSTLERAFTPSLRSRKAECIKDMYNVGMKAEEAIKACTFVEER